MPQRPPSQEPTSPIFSEKKPPNTSRNKTTPLLNVEKNKIAKPFHSNDIDKIRQRRETFDPTDEANSFGFTGNIHRFMH